MSGDAVELEQWVHAYSGKVRDLYVPAPITDSVGDAATLDETEHLLVVASDRVSAFDHVLEPGIPGKGVLLTTLSLWWFDRLSTGGDGERGIPNHLAADHELRADGLHEIIPAEVVGRAMLVKSLDMQPIECVVRGYLAGSGWAEYRQSGTVCGIALPAAQANADWTHRGGGPDHGLGHVALGGSLRPLFSVPIGEGSSRRARITGEPVVAGGRVFTLDARDTVTAFSTAGQALLCDLLGLERPTWAHVPLVLGPDGSRLAKRHGAVTLRDVGAAEARRWMAESLGFGGAGEPAELLAAFDPTRLPREATVLDPARL